VNAQDIISSGLLELYAAGLTSKEESEKIAQWAKQFPEVAKELEEIQASVEAYARSRSIEPGESVKDKIFERINRNKSLTAIPVNVEGTTAKLVGIASYWKWVAAASVLLLLGSIALNIMFYGKYDEANTNLQQTQQQLANVTDSNKNMKEDMSVVQSKYSEPVALHGMGVAPDAAAKIFWMKNTGDVYVDPSNLPDVPQGKQFQVWAIVNGKPVDAGMLLTSKKGDKYRIQKMRSFGKADAFAITIEKEGGSPTPTMNQMVVMGKM